MDCPGTDLVIFNLLFVLGHINGLNMTLDKNAINGQTVNILITPINGSITSSVSINRPDSSQAGNCGAPIEGATVYCSPSSDFSQNFTTGVTTFSVSPLDRNTDEGIWTSYHGTEEATIYINVLTLPTAITASSPAVSPFTLSNGVNSAQDFVVTVVCAYPAVTLNWFFAPTSGGTSVSAQSSSTSSCTLTGNAGCTDTDASSYNCTVIPQYEATVAGQKVYMACTLTLQGEYQSTGMNLTITDTEVTMAEISTGGTNTLCANDVAILSILGSILILRLIKY